MVTTSDFFNAFSETVEKKISAVSNKITELEILLSVLEAKLNSVPGLEFTTDDLPNTESFEKPTEPVVRPAAEVSSAPITAVVPDVVSEVVVMEPEVDSSTIKASDHPDYAAFFRLLKVGVPVFVVQAKVSAAGLDPSVIETPDAMIPR